MLYPEDAPSDLPERGSDRGKANLEGGEFARCIVARLRPSWTMKTTSKMRTGGTRILRAARSLPRSSPSGFGTCDWNWGNSSLQQHYAQRNLLQPLRLSLPRPMSLHQRKIPALRLPMVHPNGRVPPLPTAFPAPRLLRSQLEPCVARPTTRSTPRSGVLNAMGLCGSCMPHALVIVAPVP